MKETLNKWRDKIIEIAKQNLLDDQEIEPIAILQYDDENGETLSGVVPMKDYMGTALNKDIGTALIQQQCERRNVYGLIFISEVWYTSGDKNDKEADKVLSDEKRITDLPDKLEALMITFESLEKSAMYIFNIVRNAEGKITELVESEMSGSDEFVGRFANLLKKEKNEEE